MKHILGSLENLKKRIGSRAFLLLDYDGTLTPIVETPELATLDEEMRKLLDRITTKFKVAIISGRSIADIKKLVGLKRTYYAGNHGFEISGPGIKLVLPDAERFRPIISRLSRELLAKLRHVRGLIVEDKGLTASVHFRLVARRNLKALRETLEDVAGPHLASGSIKITRGKKVFEIRPGLGWDKGKAVLWIIDAVDPKGMLTPIYLGDDRTDEDAFLALKNRGITILVSRKNKRSKAKFLLRDVGEVKTFLKKMLKWSRH